MADKTMTERQQHWLNHLKAADTASISLVQYAEVHELKVKDLFQWKTSLTKRGFWTSSASSFIAVKAKPSSAVCSMVLPTVVVTLLAIPVILITVSEARRTRRSKSASKRTHKGEDPLQFLRPVEPDDPNEQMAVDLKQTEHELWQRLIQAQDNNEVRRIGILVATLLSQHPESESLQALEESLFGWHLSKGERLELLDDVPDCSGLGDSESLIGRQSRRRTVLAAETFSDRRAMMRPGGLWKEIVERKVLKSALIYIGAWFLLYSVVEVTMPAYSMPDISPLLRILFVLVVLGFSAVVVFAWYHGRSREYT